MQFFQSLCVMLSDRAMKGRRHRLGVAHFIFVKQSCSYAAQESLERVGDVREGQERALFVTAA